MFELTVRRSGKKCPRGLVRLPARAQRTVGIVPELINNWRVASHRKSPLLARPVDKAFMEEIAQALFEARFRDAAHEGMEIGRTQVSVAL
jgi:hypothetical protein